MALFACGAVAMSVLEMALARSAYATLENFRVSITLLGSECSEICLHAVGGVRIAEEGELVEEVGWCEGVGGDVCACCPACESETAYQGGL